MLELTSGFFWGGSCFLCIIYTYFRIPEPTGKSFAQLDLLFERGVPARKFATTDVDVFDVPIEDKGTIEHKEDAPSTTKA